MHTSSARSVSSMKICCSFSFTKLMQNCSKPFFCGGAATTTRYAAPQPESAPGLVRVRVALRDEGADKERREMHVLG